MHLLFNPVTGFSKDLLLKLFSSGQCEWINCIKFFTLAHCFSGRCIYIFNRSMEKTAT